LYWKGLEVRNTLSTLRTPSRSMVAGGMLMLSPEEYTYIQSTTSPLLVRAISEAVIGPLCEWQ
jgi:hypothetical protein